MINTNTERHIMTHKGRYPFTKQGDSNFKFEAIETLSKEYLDLRNNFWDDYSKIDNTNAEFQADPAIGTKLAPGNYLVKIDEKTVGFIKFRNVLFSTEGEATEIELVYVKPEYRGFGIARRIYQHAIQNYDAKFISISYQRCSMLTQIEMWRSVGFKYIQMIPGQVGSRGLVMLTTENLDTVLCLELNKRNVQRTQEKSEKISRKLSRKYGVTMNRLEVMERGHPVQSIVESVIRNQFGLSNKRYEEA